MSSKYQHPEGSVAETSNLLEKSLSDSSHLEIQKDLEVQLNCCDGKSLFKDEKRIILPFLGGLFALLILGGFSQSVWSGERVELDDRAEVNDIPIVDNASPLSLLDPVRHLKLAEHGRPYQDPSFPSYYYGTDDESPTSLPFRALPTNAWYQNLLQAPQHGEPSNLQRIYPGPYLLDVDGTIPGLRIHATDIVSNDMVMQLAFNEQYSVVLGATQSIPVSNQGDSNIKANTNRYKVLKTTDLGITLEWVS